MAPMVSGAATSKTKACAIGTATPAIITPSIHVMTVRSASIFRKRGFVATFSVRHCEKPLGDEAIPVGVRTRREIASLRSQ
jgi:hypothetical protein